MLDNGRFPPPNLIVLTRALYPKNSKMTSNIEAFKNINVETRAMMTMTVIRKMACARMYSEAANSIILPSSRPALIEISDAKTERRMQNKLIYSTTLRNPMLEGL